MTTLRPRCGYRTVEQLDDDEPDYAIINTI